MWASEIVDGSDDEDAGGEYYNAKASKKKEKKRQERQAQRQVQGHVSDISLCSSSSFS